jgi:hypothetical protein
MADFSRFLTPVDVPEGGPRRFEEILTAPEVPERGFGRFGRFLPEGERVFPARAMPRVGGVSRPVNQLAAMAQQVPQPVLAGRGSGTPGPEAFGIEGNISAMEAANIGLGLLGGPVGAVATIANAVANTIAQSQGISPSPIGRGLLANTRGFLGNIGNLLAAPGINATLAPAGLSIGGLTPQGQALFGLDVGPAGEGGVGGAGFGGAGPGAMGGGFGDPDGMGGFGGFGGGETEGIV